MGIRSQRGTAALTGRRGHRPLRNGLTRFALVEAACSTLPAAFQKETPSCRMVFLYFSRSAQQNRRGSTSLPGIPRMAEPFAGALPSPLDLTRFAPVEAACSILPAAFQKETPSYPDGVSFCDCPQVLLPALPPTARKGECEGGTFDGFPHSRSITRPQATDFAQQNRRSKKKNHPLGGFSFWSGRRGSNSLPRPWQGRALPDELRPQTQDRLYLSSQRLSTPFSQFPQKTSCPPLRAGMPAFIA